MREFAYFVTSTPAHFVGALLIAFLILAGLLVLLDKIHGKR